MPERTFYLVVTGRGSFSLGRRPSWRAGVHEIDAITAAEILAWKEKHPGAHWLVLSEVEPIVEDGLLVGPLRPEDIRNGVADGVRFPKPKQPKPANTPAGLPTAPTTTFPCHWCEREFVSAARLERHVKHNHVLKHADVEAAVRSQLEAEDAAHGADRQADDAEPGRLRPEERKAFEE